MYLYTHTHTHDFGMSMNSGLSHWRGDVYICKCNTLQHTATHCSTLQHTAAHNGAPTCTLRMLSIQCSSFGAGSHISSIHSNI